MTDKRLVLTTVSSREEANIIANELVTRHLAACVNILGPAASVYHWQGEVEQSEEYVLLIKTTESRLSHIQEAVRSLHSYQLPELLAFTVDSGLESYLEWIGSSVHR